MLLALSIPRLHKIQDQHLKMVFVKHVKSMCLTSQAAFLNKLEDFSLLQDSDLTNFMQYHAHFKSICADREVRRKMQELV